MHLAVYLPKQAWKPIYDIAGSRVINTGEGEANSYLAMTKYGSMIMTQELGQDYQYPRCIKDVDMALLTINNIKVVPKITKPYSDAEYFSTYANTSTHNAL